MYNFDRDIFKKIDLNNWGGKSLYLIFMIVEEWCYIITTTGNWYYKVKHFQTGLSTGGNGNHVIYSLWPNN